MPEPEARQLWEQSFAEQIAQHAYNTAPVEAIVRTTSYHLRNLSDHTDLSRLLFLEMGCGAGANLLWLARRSISVIGLDISPTALQLCRQGFRDRGLEDRLMCLIESSVATVPMADESFDGIIEACVFQHLGREERLATFGEVSRLLKPGGVFVGYMLAESHTVFEAHGDQQFVDDPGTLRLETGGSKMHLENIGLSHFFARGEYSQMLDGFRQVDPCLTTYELPGEEARRRGYEKYIQSMWTVYAIK